MEYIAYLHKYRKSDYGVSFPDFPGCITAGNTLEEARRTAAKALTFHIEGITEERGQEQWPWGSGSLFMGQRLHRPLSMNLNVKTMLH